MATPRIPILSLLLASALAASCSDGSPGAPDAAGEDGDSRPDDVSTDDAEEAADETDVPPFCSTQPDGTACDDGDRCTRGDACAGGTCAGWVRDCNDWNPCTTDLCDPATGECAPVWNTEPCDDGNACTLGDTCGGGSCRTGVPRDCTGMDDDCRRGECSPLTGVCEGIPMADGRPCEDGDVCTSGETCSSGICGGGLVRDCTVLDDQCNAGRCDPAAGDCVADAVPDGTACDDRASCTADDACVGGTCAGLGPDADGDGHVVVGCADGDDCDDARPDVNPGVIEGPVGRAACFDALDNDCDGLSDAASPTCDGLDWANVDRPLDMATALGSSTPLVYGRAFEPGATGTSGPMTGLWAEIGIGPFRTDPTDAPSWTWFPADYWGSGGPGSGDDVFAAYLRPAAAGSWGVAFRYTLDAGATWLYADSDGNGAAAPSNGIQIDRLGFLMVMANDHVVMTEVVVTPTEAEYVEIHNPTAAAIDLSRYYLYDAADPGTTWRYWDLPVGAPWPTVRGYDFVAAFPAGASIGPGERVVVATGSAQAFATRYGANPAYELRPATPDDPAVPDMRPAFPGSIGGAASGMLANITETVVLFRWDGTSDLVADTDVVQWGTTAEAPDKTGVSRDGPDADSAASAYRADSPPASQEVIAGAHLPGGSFERVDVAEGVEPDSGGNGLTGHDETAEDYTNTWGIAATATPGS